MAGEYLYIIIELFRCPWLLFSWFFSFLKCSLIPLFEKKKEARTIICRHRKIQKSCLCFWALRFNSVCPFNVSWTLNTDEKTAGCSDMDVQHLLAAVWAWDLEQLPLTVHLTFLKMIQFLCLWTDLMPLFITEHLLIPSLPILECVPHHLKIKDWIGRMTPVFLAFAQFFQYFLYLKQK